MFQPGSGDWKQYRSLPALIEVDLHRADHPGGGFDDHMDGAGRRTDALAGLARWSRRVSTIDPAWRKPRVAWPAPAF